MRRREERSGRRGHPAVVMMLGMALMAGTPAPGSVAGEPLAGALAHRAEVDPERIVARLIDVDTRGEAGAELLLWIRELPPERASLWLRLAVAMDRLPPDQVGAAAMAVLSCDPALETRGAGRLAAARGLRDIVLELPPTEQPVLLALAAYLLEPEAPEEALALRRRYLADGFGGPEAAEVVLAVARVLLAPSTAMGPVGAGATGAGAPVAGEEAPAVEARRILEDFLESAPEHPMAPEARRLRAVAARAGGRTP